MAPRDDLKIAGIVEPGAAIIAQCGGVRKPAEHVHFREGQGSLADASGFGGNVGAQFSEQPALDLNNFLLGV